MARNFPTCTGILARKEPLDPSGWCALRRNDCFVDGGLLEPENHLATREMCEVSAERLLEVRRRANVGHDDCFDYVVGALKAIVGGMSPNEAFAWSQSDRGRSEGNFALRNWDIQCTVHERMRKGETKEAACLSVSSDCDGEFLLGFESIKKICMGIKEDTVLPDLCELDIYPIDPKPYRRKRQPSPHYIGFPELFGTGRRRR